LKKAHVAGSYAIIGLSASLSLFIPKKVLDFLQYLVIITPAKKALLGAVIH
jgi:hypothetical protein